MKWGKFEIGNRTNWPAVVVISGNILHCQILTQAIMFKLYTDINASFCSLFQRCYCLIQGCVRSSSYSSVLLEQERLGLYRPGHELTVQANPIGLELLPEIRGIECCAHSYQHLSLKHCIIKEAATCTSVADTTALTCHTKILTRGFLIATYDHDCPRSHVLLFANNFGYTLIAIIGKCLGRML